MPVSKDKVVSIDYKLTNQQGEVLDTSEGREPLSYLHGRGNIIPGLEKALEGKAQGESLQVTVPPDEAYGERQEGLQQQVPRDRFEGVPDLQAGMQFRVQTDAGDRIVTVIAVEGDTVTLDANHVLAGETLQFDVTIRDIRDATEEELTHGHAHGPGGEHE